MIRLRPTRRAALLTLVGLGTGAAMTGPIDYASLFGGAPAGPSQNVKFRQGTILSFNQNTLQNTVSVGGSTLTDLPLLGVAEASTLVPGATVGVLVVGDDTSAKTMFVIGRSVIPNTVDATNAISLLNSQIFSDFIGDPPDTCASTVYTDLAQVGPTVNVPIGPTGRVLVIASAQMQWTSAVGAVSQDQGRIAVELTGANNIPASDTGPLLNMFNISNTVSAGTITQIIVATMTTQANMTELIPGNTQFRLKYKNNHAAVNTSDFTRRTLTVIKL